MTAINTVTDLAIEGVVAIITLNSPPVNALSGAMREGLIAAISQADTDPDVQAILILCEGRTFIAGADINEFGKTQTGPTFRDIQDTMDAVSKPIVTGIHGTALGGGLELALLAHYRIAVQTTRFGFPEVNLGLIPGAGGTQRLPRLAGVPKALEMIVSGQVVGAEQALSFGLIDAVVPEGRLKPAALDFAHDAIALGVRRTRDLDAKLHEAKVRPEIFKLFRTKNARKLQGAKAPDAAMAAIEAAVTLPFDKGLTVERNLFDELVTSPESKAQRYAFFAERKAAKIPDIADDTPTLPINKVGVIGAGLMGGGIAMNFANAGVPVTIIDVQSAALERGLSVVKKNYEASAKRGRFTSEEATRRFSLLNGSLDLEDIADCDLIIEAVFEQIDIKKDLFRKLDKVARPTAILATNTSRLDINEIASASSRPDRVLGLHFFSPANVMKLVEIVRGDKTSKTVIATSMRLARKINKISVLVGAGPGFVGNRMLAQRSRESQKLVLEGAMPWDVDRVMTEFGFPMGPFAMGDLVGLNLFWRKSESKGENLIELLCELGRYGQSTGAGYYDYDSEREKAVPSPITETLIAGLMAKRGIAPRKISDEEILARCLYPMINEGAKILEEGIAIRCSDIDVVWLNGYGWPRYRGGPMFYADTVGLDNILAVLMKYEAIEGDTWRPASLLRSLVSNQKGFADLH